MHWKCFEQSLILIYIFLICNLSLSLFLCLEQSQVFPMPATFMVEVELQVLLCKDFELDTQNKRGWECCKKPRSADIYHKMLIWISIYFIHLMLFSRCVWWMLVNLCASLSLKFALFFVRIINTIHFHTDCISSCVVPSTFIIIFYIIYTIYIVRTAAR